MTRNRHQKQPLSVPPTRPVTTRAGGETTSTQEAVAIRQIPIMWGVPMDEVMYSKFFTVFLKNSYMMPWDGFATTESTYLPNARNTIHKAFVEQSNLPYLMMLDSDILFPPHLVARLMAHNLPIIGGWYKNKQIKSKNHPIIYDFVSETETALNWRHREQPGQGLEKVDGMGAGCWLMRRDVAEALGPEPYSMEKGTEDLVICRKLMKLGIPLHVDWNIELAHLGVSYV